jgi:GntR family transcriptional regulator
MLHLKLQPASPIPIYLQIVDQVRHSVVAGALRPEDELPSVRSLASKYLINPNTVARAYLELEREGLVSKKRGTGTYISAEAAGCIVPEQRIKIVADLLDKALSTAMEFGFSRSDIRELLDDRLERILPKASVTGASNNNE